MESIFYSKGSSLLFIIEIISFISIQGRKHYNYIVSPPLNRWLNPILAVSPLNHVYSAIETNVLHLCFQQKFEFSGRAGGFHSSFIGFWEKHIWFQFSNLSIFHQLPLLLRVRSVARVNTVPAWSNQHPAHTCSAVCSGRSLAELAVFWCSPLFYALLLPEPKHTLY